ncbi:MAG: hypothetical protein ABJB10_04900, partial [Mesorhizobium sp.]
TFDPMPEDVAVFSGTAGLIDDKAFHSIHAGRAKSNRPHQWNAAGSSRWRLSLFWKIVVRMLQAISALCFFRPRRRQPPRLAGSCLTLSQTIHVPDGSGKHSNLVRAVAIAGALRFS